MRCKILTVSVQNHACSSTQIKREIALFLGKIYTAGTNFTRPSVVTVATNLNSGNCWNLGEPVLEKHREISCLLGRLISGSWSNIGSSSSSESFLRDTNFRFIPMIMLLPDLASCENSEIIDNAREMFSTNCSWLNTSEPLQTMHLPTNSWLPAVKSVDLINHLIKGLTINSR